MVPDVCDLRAKGRRDVSQRSASASLRFMAGLTYDGTAQRNKIA
jgi:hypothetical protein